MRWQVLSAEPAFSAFLQSPLTAEVFHLAAAEGIIGHAILRESRQALFSDLSISVHNVLVGC